MESIEISCDYVLNMKLHLTGTIWEANTQVGTFVSRCPYIGTGLLSRPVASCTLDSRVQEWGGGVGGDEEKHPARDGRAAFPPEIHHVIELFGVGNRSVTCSCFMLQHTVNCHILANLSSPLFIFCPLSLSNCFFSEQQHAGLSDV